MLNTYACHVKHDYICGMRVSVICKTGIALHGMINMVVRALFFNQTSTVLVVSKVLFILAVVPAL